MVDNSSIEEILRLFKEDHPLKAWEMLQGLLQSGDPAVLKFAESEEMVLLKSDVEILSSF